MRYPFSKANVIFKEVAKLKSAEQVAKIAAAEDHHYLIPDKGYYLGGWFEEWLFHFLKTELRLSDKQIAFSMKLKGHDSLRKSEGDNEIDIAFVYQNKLFVWECKVY